MITTIGRYKWLRIDGESYKVAAGDFFDVPMMYACPNCYGHHNEGTPCPKASANDAGGQQK